MGGMAAVLHEQDRQIFEERQDPERLAKVYSEVNAHCMEEAIALGAQDEVDIQEYMSSDNEPFYDADDSARSSTSTSSRGLISRSFSSGKRGGKLRSNGSFHERSIRGLKRIFSGKSDRRAQIG